MNIRPGYTLDTGALIALEGGDKRMRDLLDSAQTHDVSVTVPAVVLIEWWQGGSGGRGAFIKSRQREILSALRIEHTTEAIAMLAGEAFTASKSGAVDAAVMAHAALRGDLVITSDMDDLGKLQAFFPNVRLVSATGV